MDIKELAPLVIFGIIFLVRALAGGQKTKKRRQAPEQTVPKPKSRRPQGGGLEEAIEEIVRTYKNEEESPPAALKHDEAMSVEEGKYHIQSIEYESREAITKEEATRKKLRTPSLLLDEEVVSDLEFDPRLAVIYSEIMNRPEW